MLSFTDAAALEAESLTGNLHLGLVFCKRHSTAFPLKQDGSHQDTSSSLNRHLREQHGLLNPSRTALLHSIDQTFNNVSWQEQTTYLDQTCPIPRLAVSPIPVTKCVCCTIDGCHKLFLSTRACQNHAADQHPRQTFSSKPVNAQVIGVTRNHILVPVKTSTDVDPWQQPTNEAALKFYNLGLNNDLQTWALGNLMVGDSQVSEFINVMAWKEIMLQCDLNWLAKLHSKEVQESDPTWLVTIVDCSEPLWDSMYQTLHSHPNHSFRKVLKG